MAEPSATALAFRPDPLASYKLIYLARRNPSLTPDEFPQAWREHSQLASTFGPSLGRHFLGVRQCVKDIEASPGASFENDYDGSSILAMKSWEDLMAARYHPHSLDELAKDEVRVFAGAVDDWTMAVEEHVLRDGEAEGYVLLSFLTPQDGAAPFTGTHPAKLAGLDTDALSIQRLVWNRVVDPARSYAFTAIIEAWFAARDDALRAVRIPSFVEAMEQPAAFSPDDGVRLFARINHAKTMTADGSTC